MKALTAAWLILAAGLGSVVHAAPPQWAEDKYSGLDPQTVFVGLGESEYKPEIEVSTTIAYAFACWDAAKAVANRLSKIDRVFEEAQSNRADSGRLAETAEKSMSNSPLCSGLFRDYRADDGDLIELPIRVRRFADAEIKLFMQEHRDDEGRTLYVRTVLPASAADYAKFVKDNGSTDLKILASMFKGVGPLEAIRRTRALRQIKERLGRDSETLGRMLGPDFQPWSGGDIKLYMGRLSKGGSYQESMRLTDAEAGTSWEESLPRGRAVFTRAGTETKYRFEESRREWVPDVR